MTTETVLTTHAASGVSSFAWLLIALPLLGAAILLLGGRRTNRWGHLLGTGMSIGAFVVGFAIFLQMLGRDTADRAVTDHLYTFVQTGRFDVQASLLIDQLSICFVLLITFVGSLIHVYSIGYMEHDPNRRKFFGYLNLFIASMLLLVLADSYLLLYVGWEGVGLASYLLDAMEGPTPVSALIHAATMVTAGVYLIVRSAPVFDLAPSARTAVIVVGAATLIFGGIIGSAKDDIKKALAGSTMSQIGYMVVGAGLGTVGYVFAIFMLICHGFYKAGLFLGAGSVMHG